MAKSVILSRHVMHRHDVGWRILWDISFPQLQPCTLTYALCTFLLSLVAALSHCLHFSLLHPNHDVQTYERILQLFVLLFSVMQWQKAEKTRVRREREGCGGWSKARWGNDERAFCEWTSCELCHYKPALEGISKLTNNADKVGCSKNNIMSCSMDTIGAYLLTRHTRGIAYLLLSFCPVAFSLLRIAYWVPFVYCDCVAVAAYCHQRTFERSEPRPSVKRPGVTVIKNAKNEQITASSARVSRSLARQRPVVFTCGWGVANRRDFLCFHGERKSIKRTNECCSKKESILCF